MMLAPDPGYYPGIFEWGGGKPIKKFYRRGQLFVYWGPIISHVYSICMRESFEYLSISKRKFSVFVNFHAKILKIYQFPSENIQFLSIFMRNLWIFINFHAKIFSFVNFHAKFLIIYQFPCEYFPFLSISMRNFSVDQF